MRLLIGIVVVLVGCGPAPKAAGTSAPADPTPRASSSSSAQPANSAPLQSAPQPTTTAAATPLVDLLHWTPSVVAVSSRVDNPRDFAEHLVDNNVATAWNGKTGNLVGGYIRFRVAEGTRVRRIELTPGFDKVLPKGDLFAMNHRIAKVRVSRRQTNPDSWVTLRDATLDPDNRKLQAIEIDTPGGEIQVEVLEVKPGTKKEWRELVVSELRVFGDPGRHRLTSARMPNVQISTGSDGEMLAEPVSQKATEKPPTFDGSLPLRAKTMKELCDAYEKIAQPLLKQEYAEGSYSQSRVERSPCGEIADVLKGFKPQGAVKAIREVEVNALYGTDRRFAIETAAGFVLPRDGWLFLRPYEPGIHGENSVKVTSATVDTASSSVVVRLVDTYKNSHWCIGDTGGWDLQKISTYEVRCPIDGDVCRRVDIDMKCVRRDGVTPVSCSEVY